MTVARGAVRYAEMAVDMALSLRDWSSEPVILAADAESLAHVRRTYPRVFDDVVLLPPRYGAEGRTSKFGLAEVTPLGRTLFIDADTLVLSDPGDVLDQARNAEFLMMGTYRTAETSASHHGFSVAGLIRDFGLQRYFSNHSGAFAFERACGLDFLAECYEVYAGHLYRPSRRIRGFVGDELAFGVVAGRRGVTIMREPFPVYWPNELRQLGPDNHPKPFCHFYASPPAETLDWLMAGVVERRLRHDVPGDSVAHWKRKAAVGRFKIMTDRAADTLHRALRGGRSR